LFFLNGTPGDKCTDAPDCSRQLNWFALGAHLSVCNSKVNRESGFARCRDLVAKSYRKLYTSWNKREIQRPVYL